MKAEDRIVRSVPHKDRAAHHVSKWKVAVYSLAIVASILGLTYLIFMYELAKSFE